MMLLAPWGLLALALTPPILLLYLLRGIRQRRVMPSVQFWEGEARQITASARWRRPPLEVLMLLQILLVVVGAVALSRPGLPGQPRPNLIIVLDASASMQARDGSVASPGVRETRFDQARRMALNLVDQLGHAGSVTVIRAGASPSVLYSGTDQELLQPALARASPGDGPSDMQAALFVAGSLAAGHTHAENQVVVLSDGDFGVIPDVAGLGVPVRTVLIGSSTDNQAISTVVARRSGVGGGVLEGFSRIANYADQPAEIVVSAFADGAPLETRPVHLEPRARQDLTFGLPPGTKRFGVSLGGSDILSIDDTTQTTVEAAVSRKVLLVSASTTPLATALRAMPNVDLVIEPPGSYDGTPADLVVFDHFLPADLPPGPLVVVHPPAGGTLIPVGGEAFDVEPTHVERASPILQGVDTASLRFSGAGIVETPEWATAVVSARDIPLVLHGLVDGRRVVVLGFDPSLSHLGQTAALPVLVANALNWASGSLAGIGVNTGEPVLLQVPRGATAVDVQRPDGSVGQAEIRGTIAVWRDTERVGLYQARAEVVGDSRPMQSFEVRLPDDRPIDVTPLSHVELATGGSEAVPVEGAPIEIWPWLLLVAAGLCMAEWWYFARHG